MPTAPDDAVLHATAKESFAVAHARHKRETNARRPNRAAVIVGPLAVLATASAVTLGIVTGDPAVSEAPVARQASDELIGAHTSTPVTRSGTRKQPADASAAAAEPSLMSQTAVRKAIKKADTQLWTTAELNLWSEPGEQARNLGELDAGEKVLVTGREAKGRVEIVLGGESRWVTEGYLSDEKPPTLGGECTNGTSVAGGANVIAVHRAVCAAFPSITSYGTLRGGGGDHGAGRAIDIMVSGGLGYQVADFVREHYDALGVTYVIYAQRIWSVERGGEGWRGMSNRGSTTANHYDHVHVSTY